MNTDNFDPYKVLGVAKDADADAIKAAYRLKAKQHHTDAGGDDAEMAAVNRAYEILSDPARKAAYDAGEQDPTDLEREVEEGVLLVFAAVVGDLPADPRADVLALCRRKVAGKVGEFETTRRQAKEAEGNFQRLAPRIKRKDGGERDVIAEWIAGRIAAAKETQRVCELNIAKAKRVMAKLEEWEDGGIPDALPDYMPRRFAETVFQLPRS